MTTYLIWISAYLLGSIPFGFLVAKAQNINLREHGSGNIGATNVARVLGKKQGLLTLIGDTLKGLAAVAIATVFLGQEMEIAVAGLLAYLGHLFSIFLKFKGGKGVATGLGILLFLMPKAALCTVAVFTATLFLSGYVSISSILAALLLPVFGIFLNAPVAYIFTATLIAILTTLKHRDNFQRLMEGPEAKFLRK